MQLSKFRNRASMNFMVDLEPGLVPNQEMKELVFKASIKFVDERISLAVLRPISPEEIVCNNFSFFLVPKPHQFGEFRAIADG